MDLSQKRKKWDRFMAGSADVKNMVMISYLNELEAKPFISDGCYMSLSEWIIRKYHIMMDNLDWLDDDTIPYLDMLTGTEIFAEAFGCKVVYPTDSGSFAFPLISDYAEIEKLKIPDLWDTRLSDLFAMGRYLRDKTDKDAIIRLPDIQSPTGIAAMIMKKENFLMGLIEAPEVIRELIYKVRTLLISFLDAWFDEFGKSFVAHYPDYYMEYGLTLSEDEVGSVSADMFEDVFLDELNILSERYGRIGIHCCANSRHQWDNFLKINNLCLLNILQPVETVKEAYRFFENKCAQWHSYYGDNPMREWKRELPQNARVVYSLDAKDRSKALRYLEALRD